MKQKALCFRKERENDSVDVDNNLLKMGSETSFNSCTLHIVSVFITLLKEIIYAL